MLIYVFELTISFEKKYVKALTNIIFVVKACLSVHEDGQSPPEPHPLSYGIGELSLALGVGDND